MRVMIKCYCRLRWKTIRVQLNPLFKEQFENALHSTVETKRMALKKELFSREEKPGRSSVNIPQSGRKLSKKYHLYILYRTQLYFKSFCKNVHICTIVCLKMEISYCRRAGRRGKQQWKSWYLRRRWIYSNPALFKKRQCRHFGRT